MAYDLSTYEGRQEARDDGYFVGSEGGQVYAEYIGREGGDFNAPQIGGGGDGGGGGGGGGVAPARSGGGGGSLDSQFQRMLEALASGNRERFEFEKDQFNRTFTESIRQFDANYNQRNLEMQERQRQFGETLGENRRQFDVTTAEGRRQFDTKIAEEQRQWDQQFGEGRRQFDVTTQEGRVNRQVGLGSSLLSAATGLRGPRDYLQYQQLTRGGRSLLDQLTANDAIAQSQGAAGPLRSINLADVLGDIGFDPSQYGVNVQSAQGGGQATPEQAELMRAFGLSAGQSLTPNMINPVRWDEIGQIGRDLTKNLAETRFGYDADDFERQINAQRPAGTATRLTSRGFQAPRGIY